MSEINEKGSRGIIPHPARVEWGDGRFRFNRETRFVVHTQDPFVDQMTDRFVNRLNTSAWHTHSVETGTDDGSKNTVHIRLDPDMTDPKQPEGYLLNVTPEQITLRARDSAGLFYGLQTLRQLLPEEVEVTDPTLVPRNRAWTVPEARIEDVPRFAYRGLHLDVGRHLFPVEFIKKYIDLMALYKFNRFHWHLTEDQGWRIEIEQYPELTKTGAWRDETQIGTSDRGDGIPYGGFYSQEEVRDIVRYAENRCVTIVPEIDVPGHSTAALAAYPELGNDPDRSYSVSTTWGIKTNLYAPREHTFEFLENVFREVIELFPGTYIHIGGDEVPKEQWKRSEAARQVMNREGLADEMELKSYFVNRVVSFLHEQGRRAIGWDELMEGDLSPEVSLMSWRGMDGGIQAARNGHDVVMTPTSHCYFDYYQAEPEDEPLARDEVTTVRDVYSLEPVPDSLDGEATKHVLGTQGNVWTEFMKSGKKVEYMAYPRAIALAEVSWSPPKRREWRDFRERLQGELNRLDHLDVNFAKHAREDHCR